MKRRPGPALLVGDTNSGRRGIDQRVVRETEDELGILLLQDVGYRSFALHRTSFFVLSGKDGVFPAPSVRPWTNWRVMVGLDEG